MGYYKRGEVIYRFKKNAESWKKSLKKNGQKSKVVKIAFQRYRVDKWEE